MVLPKEASKIESKGPGEQGEGRAAAGAGARGRGAGGNLAKGNFELERQEHREDRQGKARQEYEEGGVPNFVSRSSASADGAPGSKREAKERLQELRELFDDGLIDKEEFDTKRAAIIASIWSLSFSV